VSEAHNICGRICALTVLTPIQADHETDLARHLDGLPGGDASPLASVPGTHFARWVVIGDVVYEGPDQPQRDHLKLPRLLFTSNFEGTLDDYLEDMRTGLGERADQIWHHCLGYPGHTDARAFADYFRAHKVDSSLFFAAYPQMTVAQVKRSLATRNRVIDFALESQGLPAPQLRAAFLREFEETAR
jgi:hypothetical protein